MDLQFKCLPFELKASSGDGTFEGLCAAFMNIDSSGEIIDPEAFNADLPAFMQDGFIGGLNHNWDNPIGKPLAATPTKAGLQVKGKISNTPHGMECKTLMSDGVVKKMSIGYMTMGDMYLEDMDACMAYWQSKSYTPNAQDMARCQYGARVLTRVKLYEFSPVTVPANDLATITAVKNAALAAAKDVVEKAASGSTSLPIAARDHAWDGPGAEKRVRAWADAADGPNAKYRSAFFVYDPENADQFGAYHLGFADVINGTLTAIPRGVFACAGVLQGARGADGSKYAEAKPKIERYYARFRTEFNDDSIVVPWAGKSSGDDAEFAAEWMSQLDEAKTLSDIEEFLREAGHFSKKQATAFVSRFKTLLREAASETNEPEKSETSADATQTEENVETKTSEKPAIVETPQPPAIVPLAVDTVPPAILRKRQELAAREYQRFLDLSSGHYTANRS